MEPKFQTSFIPKKAVTAIPMSTKRTGTRSFGLISIITVIMFLGSIALSVGAFLYLQFTKQAIAEKTEQLTRARAAFDISLIEDLKRLDTRMKAADEIMGKHTKLTSLFDLLEESTLKTVQFETFDYSVGADGKVTISMRGNAKSYSSVALQSDLFGKNKMLQEAMFSNLDLDQKGNVTFSFTAYVDPTLLSYSDTVGSQVAEQ
jgi:hypothetical protein